MDETRSSTPEPPQDLWSSILDSVSSTRTTPCKNILLLGQPSSGKSTLAAALLRKYAGERDRDDAKSDYALGYDYAVVRDDADEDTLATLSLYTVPSTAPAFLTILPHFLPPRTCLLHTLVIVALDWTKPWTFVEELQAWFKWIDEWTRGDGSREVQIAREECRERYQSFLQHYTEPTSDPIPATSHLSNTTLPLGPGVFTHNSSGIPIIVACTKADLIDEGNDLVAGASGMGGMVKGKGGEWEERTDGIMQILRTMCLKYGAALFYTTPMPATLQVLRQYALHVLFAPSIPSSLPSVTDAAAPIRNPFPFRHKPNTLDRDQIVIPAGWDSWGKISVMRDAFNAKLWGEAWEHDLHAVEGVEQPGAKRLYSVLVPDQGPKPYSLPPFNSPMPEQTFLARNYDENAKKSDKDSCRGTAKVASEFAGTVSAGVVGPLGSSSFTMPAVERALTEMEIGVGSGAVSNGDPRRRGTGRPPPSLGTSTPSAATATPGRTGSSPTGGPSPTQHEVLKNFFQSLLVSRDGGSGATSTGSRQSAPKASGGKDDVGA